jgi:membrane-bound lytic murein transglycosylase F
MYHAFGVVFMMSFLLAAGCTRLEAPLPKDELVVALRNTPAFVEEGGSAGFERDLIDSFAAELGLKVRLIQVRDHDELMILLREGKAHLAASVMPATHLAGLRYTVPLRESGHVLVQSANAILLDEPEALAGRQIEVLSGSPQSALLRAQRAAESARPQAVAASAVLPGSFLISERVGLNEIELLERVSQRKSELAATDRLHYDIAVTFFPDLQIARELPGHVELVWAFPAQGDPVLYSRANAFIQRIRKDGTLARLNDRYFGYIHRLDAHEITLFLKRLTSLLPRFRSEFVAAQEITGLDWRLLAAIAYQESHWDPLATSYTNVRGMMMLTEDTADRLRVTDRLDARQSILAGARYLAELKEQLPPEVAEPDRTWLAMAAYNLGMGHLNGARFIATLVKRDPNSWYEMKQVLPLLAKPEYYARLKSGAARGGEAVIMTENIRTYYDILRRYEKAGGQPSGLLDELPMSPM